MITQTVTTGQYDIYVDGVSLTGGTGIAIDPGTTPVLAGSTDTLTVGWDSGGYPLVGSMDDFNLYNSVLSPGADCAIVRGQVDWESARDSGAGC